MNRQTGTDESPISPNVPKRVDEPFARSMIPYFLYRGISEFLGIGEEERVKDRNGLRLLHNLNPDHEMVGFQGQIQFVQFLENTYFRLYLHPDINSDEHIFEALGGPRSGGLHSALDGTLMVDALTWSIPLKGLPADCPAMRLIANILLAMNDLITNPSCCHEEFWSGRGFK